MSSAADPEGWIPGCAPWPETAVCPDSPVLLHPQGKELLAQKLPLWQQACADPNKVPDRAVQLMQQMASSNGAILPGALSASKSNLVISDPIPGAKPLPVPPELAPFVGVSLVSRKLLGCGGTAPLCSSWHPAAAGSEGPSCNPRPCRLFPTAAVCPGEHDHHEWRLRPRQRGLQPLG